MITDLDYFLARVRRPKDPDKCWIWLGPRHGSPYPKRGKPKSAGGTAYGHRVLYEHFVGPIPEGYEVDHLCNNSWCFNPKHLEAVTLAENRRRQAERRREARNGKCKQGHPASMTYWKVQTKAANGGHWGCRMCDNASQRIPVQRRPFKCELCPYRFTTKLGLSLHKGMKHREEEVTL